MLGMLIHSQGHSKFKRQENKQIILQGDLFHYVERL